MVQICTEIEHTTCYFNKYMFLSLNNNVLIILLFYDNDNDLFSTLNFLKCSQNYRNKCPLSTV